MSRRMLALWGLMIAVVLSAAPVAQAQGQRPGGFGGGGFGRGMGGGGGLMGLALMEPVQKELGLEKDSAEIAEIRKLTEAMGKEMQEEMGKITGGDPMAAFNASPEERQKMMAKMGEVTTKLTAKYNPDVKKILKPEQYTRLQQISLQAAGVQALSNPEVVKALEITKEQQEKLEATAGEFRTKQMELFQSAFQGGGGGDREEMQKKMTELNSERDKKVAEILSKEQQEKFKDLKGKEFDMALLRPQGGFGGGGGRGFGGGGAGGGGRNPGRPGNKAADKKADEKKE